MSSRTDSDKFLLAIVAGILLIAVAAFVIIARRPGPQFKDENTPEGVVHDYLLAIQLADYERAFDHLSPEIAYPADINEFYDSLQLRPWEFNVEDNFSLVVEETETVGEGSVAVIVRQIYNNNSLFGGDGYSDTFRMRVEETGEGWKLVSGDRFWSTCWGESNECDELERRIP